MVMYRSLISTVLIAGYFIGAIVIGLTSSVVYQHDSLLWIKIYNIWLTGGYMGIGLWLLLTNILYLREERSPLVFFKRAFFTTLFILMCTYLYAWIWPDTWRLDVTFDGRKLSLLKYSHLPSGTEVSMHRQAPAEMLQPIGLSLIGIAFLLSSLGALYLFRRKQQSHASIESKTSNQ